MIDIAAITIAFGRHLQKLRKQRGFSQAGLAAEIGRSSGAVSQWERGLTLPNIDTLMRLLDVFDIPLAELIEPLG